MYINIYLLKKYALYKCVCVCQCDFKYIWEFKRVWGIYYD